MTPVEQSITLLYAGYFGRAPDKPGFDFWLNEANRGGSLVDIANAFAQSPEYLSLYGEMNNGEMNNGALIDAIYANLFDRAPDPAGKAYWQAQLDSGVSSGRLIIDVMSGAQGADRIILDNAVIVAQDWTSRAPAAFDIAAAHLAIESINERQPGNGITINIVNETLIPYLHEIENSIGAAWKQWELHFPDVQIQIDVGHVPIPGGNILASAAPRMEVVTGLGYTQSGVAQEIITGMDPNGRMADGFINIHYDLPAFFGQYNATAIFAHEIGHFFYRTQINSGGFTSYDRWLSASGGSPHFDGPNAMQVYGGPVPIPKDGAFFNWAHFDDGAALMYPYFNQFETRSVGLIDVAVLRDIGITIT